MEHAGPYRTKDQMEPNVSIYDHTGPYRTIQGLMGPYRAIVWLLANGESLALADDPKIFWLMMISRIED